MGRYYWSKKEEADYLNKVEIYWLKRQGYLVGWKSGTIIWTHRGSGHKSSVGVEGNLIGEEKYIRFHYTQTSHDTGEKRDYDYKIPLTTTPCYFGGVRYWFICPWYANGIYCGRRVGVLYMGGKYFACRHCYDLTYNSRNLGGVSKAAGQVISMPELDRLEGEAKRRFYKGKITKRYGKFLKKQDKSFRQLQIMAGYFEGRL